MGYQPNRNFRCFENTLGLMYVSVNGQVQTKRRGNKIDNSRIVNILIHNDKTSSSKKLYPDNLVSENITGLVFEQNYDEKNKKIVFGKSELVIRNNQDIEKRRIKNRILISVLNDNSGETRLVSFNKNGEDERLITLVSSNSEWFLDAHNDKIRVIIHSIDEIKIESFEW